MHKSALLLSILFGISVVSCLKEPQDNTLNSTPEELLYFNQDHVYSEGTNNILNIQQLQEIISESPNPGNINIQGTKFGVTQLVTTCSNCHKVDQQAEHRTKAFTP